MQGITTDKPTDPAKRLITVLLRRLVVQRRYRHLAFAKMFRRRWHGLI